MSVFDDSNVELFDVNGRSINLRTPFRDINQNGFFLCRRGNATLVMDDRAYEVRAGDMYIYPAFSQTHIRRVSEDVRGVAGTADFNFVLSSLSYISNTRSYIYIRFHPIVSLTAGQQRRIEDIIELVRNRKDMHTKLGKHVLSALVSAFCYEVIDAYITNNSMRFMKQTRKDKTFENFLASLYQNFYLHRNVGFYAEQQSLTPRYFATLIRQVSGKSPLQWISLFVIIEAKRLLSNPKISVKEVADRLNFADQSFFGRYFRLYAGCSPSEYKNAALTED